MRTLQRLLFINFVAALLFACSTVGMPTPQTFNERLAAGYVTVTTVRDTATTLVSAGKISATDAQNVQTQADNARAALDLARDAFKSNPTAAQDKLGLTISALSALQSYLINRSK